MINVGQVIGPWQINKIIDSSHDTIIAEVSTYKIPYEDLCSYLDNETTWIMKLRSYNSYNNEIKKIIKYNLDTCKYAVKFPKNDYYFKGDITNNKSEYEWFVMEKFTGDLFSNRYNIINYSNLTKDVINFLRYLHLKYQAVHSDLKLRNVLMNDNIFRVCDYESISRIKNNYIISEVPVDEEYHVTYYYYSFGCEIGKSYLSYRYDLESFGYLLWNIINKGMLKFQREAHKLYDLKYNKNDYNYLEKLRLEENMPKIIKMYKELISKIDWDLETPPDDKIYDEIIDLIEKEGHIEINNDDTDIED
jgi:hypothetical protein